MTLKQLNDKKLYQKTLQQAMKKFQLLLLSITMGWASVTLAANEVHSGEVIGRHIFGLATDYQGDPVLINDKPLIYQKPGFQQEISFDKQHFFITGFTHTIGGLYLTWLNKDKRPIDTKALDLATIDGLHAPTAGILTPWNTLMLSESQLLDAANPKSFIDIYKFYYKGKASLVNPYKSGWVSEVIVMDEKGLAKAIKDYAIGRLFAQQTIIMPDGKTVYLLDKQGNLYCFIAENANSMAKGKLYALHRQQQNVKYVLLGKSSALKNKFKLKKIKFKKIFKTRAVKNQQCPKKYHYAKTIYGEECLKLQRKNKKYAAFFEPLRILAIKHITPFAQENSKFNFDEKSAQLVFSENDGKKSRFSLENNQNLQSQFIIKEPI